jgi:hypothetical protein
MTGRSTSTEKWGCFEIRLKGKTEKNPFTDVFLGCEFSCGTHTIAVNGFYDGDDTYIVRFMPEWEGIWRYRTKSNVKELSDLEGTFECVPPTGENRGPVRVYDGTNFSYADGTPYYPVGTTCYVWNHQGERLEEQTLKTLRSAPFNKMRMCVFPKRYRYNYNEPECYPFEGHITGEWNMSMRDNYTQKPLAEWNYERFSPAYFRHLEKRVLDLQKLGIEADIILFHGYDFGAWGFDKMPRGVNERYLRYIVARLSAFRNVWWSFANEYDLMPAITMEDWHDFFKLVRDYDPYGHLRSIHNCRAFYDHSLPWVTHCSIQSSELDMVDTWVNRYWKPVVIDECGYEGDIEMSWGDLTAEELVHRFWTGFSRGGYVGHGETYLNPEEVLWWSKGGTLHGKSPERIAFLRRIFEESELYGLKPISTRDRSFLQGGCDGISHHRNDYYLIYLGHRQPSKRYFDLGSDAFKVDIIDTWNMTIEAAGRFSGKCEVPLPRKPRIALRLVREK